MLLRWLCGLRLRTGAPLWWRRQDCLIVQCRRRVFTRGDRVFGRIGSRRASRASRLRRRLWLRRDRWRWPGWLRRFGRRVAALLVCRSLACRLTVPTAICCQPEGQSCQNERTGNNRADSNNNKHICHTIFPFAAGGLAIPVPWQLSQPVRGEVAFASPPVAYPTVRSMSR